VISLAGADAALLAPESEGVVLRWRVHIQRRRASRRWNCRQAALAESPPLPNAQIIGFAPSSNHHSCDFMGVRFRWQHSIRRYRLNRIDDWVAPCSSCSTASTGRRRVGTRASADRLTAISPPS